jgi:ABC-type molybdenum transport system ATPase subunit/photorepair protein PhrA
MRRTFLKIKLETPITIKEYDRLIHYKKTHPYMSNEDILKLNNFKSQKEQKKILKEIKKSRKIKENKKVEQYSKFSDKEFIIRF